ncbi:MAG: caspase family protein [Archangium sp.]|nr:caspase family protein [Archangium sp.]
MSPLGERVGGEGARTLFFVTFLLASAAFADGRRLALVVGENRGLISEETLRFAERDASRMQSALVDVGGFSASDVIVLSGANATGVRNALSLLRGRIEEGPVERLVIYVSSHAGDGVLHLAGTELPLKEIVEFLKQSPAQVGVFVLDACQSGSMTRTKGLRPIASAQVTRLEATGVEGRVLISASGADEYAQESDALGGSYFTHYFIAAMRGAADTSRDGKVTLDEAYAWAWARTIEATFSTRGGVQRPAYSVDLRGSGQLVLAEPSRSTSQLVLDVKKPGHWLVVSEQTSQVIADVEKGEGALNLAVPPGGYRVQLRAKDSVFEHVVEVPASGGAVVSDADLERASLTRVARKGGEEVMLHLSAGGGATSGLVTGLSAQPTVGIRLRRDAYFLAVINQLAGEFIFRQGTPLRGSFDQIEFELRLGAGHRFSFGWQKTSIAIALEVGPILIHQSRLPDATTRTSLGLTAGLALEGRVQIIGPVEFFVLGSGGGALVKKLIGPSLIPRLSISGGLGVSF